MPIKIQAEETLKNFKEGYVGVGGVNKKLKQALIGINGVNKVLWESMPYINLQADWRYFPTEGVTDINIDNLGRLYFSQSTSNIIRRLTTSGALDKTVATSQFIADRFAIDNSYAIYASETGDELAKWDSAGVKKWTTSSLKARPLTIAYDPAGFVLSFSYQSTNKSLYKIKASTGVKTWEKTAATSGLGYIYDIKVDSAGNYIVAGVQDLSSTGSIVKQYSSSGAITNIITIPNSIATNITLNGSDIYIVAQGMVIKIDYNGAVQWSVDLRTLYIGQTKSYGQLIYKDGHLYTVVLPPESINSVDAAHIIKIDITTANIVSIGILPFPGGVSGLHEFNGSFYLSSFTSQGWNHSYSLAKVPVF